MSDCNICGVPLTKDNWPGWAQKSGTYRCQSDLRLYCKSYKSRHKDQESYREKWRESARRSSWRGRLKVINMLGGQCVHCGETNPLVLTINHKGKREKRDQHSGRRFYYLVLKGKRITDDLEIACMNCQIIYEILRGRRYKDIPEYVKPMLDAYFAARGRTSIVI